VYHRFGQSKRPALPEKNRPFWKNETIKMPEIMLIIPLTNGKLDWIKAPLLKGAVSLKADWRIHPA
jgi:hypothetical protein